MKYSRAGESWITENPDRGSGPLMLSLSATPIPSAGRFGSPKIHLGENPLLERDGPSLRLDLHGYAPGAHARPLSGTRRSRDSAHKTRRRSRVSGPKIRAGMP